MIEEEPPILLGSDFYSFALFAFYFVDEDEKLIYRSPVVKKRKGKALTEDEQELEFKRYSRRIRNNNILFKCLAIFII